MKNKTSLTLLEQLVMTLVFAIGGALSLGAFGRAAVIQNETEIKQQAVFLAQSTAELLKTGDVRRLNTPGYFRVEIQEKSTDNPLLKKVMVEIYYKGDLIYGIETGWQEVG